MSIAITSVMKKFKFISPIASLFLIMIFFQNCGGEMQFDSRGANSQNPGNSGQTNPNPVPPDIEDGVRDFNKDGGTFAIVFEDRLADDIDWDYNDMVVKFSVKEFYNSNYQLQKIEMMVYPRPFEASFSDALRFSADGLINGIGGGVDRNSLVRQTKPLFEGPGNIVVARANANTSCYAGGTFDKLDDVVIYPNQQVSAYPISSNTGANRCVYLVTVNIDDPSQNPLSSRPGFDVSQYRFFLYASNENRIVDVINVNDKFVGYGRPLGIFVPANFAYPPPARPMTDFYPYFAAYAQWAAKGHPPGADPKVVEWYKYPNGNKGQLIDLL